MSCHNPYDQYDINFHCFSHKMSLFSKFSQTKSSHFLRNPCKIHARGEDFATGLNWLLKLVMLTNRKLLFFCSCISSTFNIASN